VRLNETAANDDEAVLRILSRFAKGWNTILRLYGALEASFTKTVRPGELKLVQ
jgi:hypothetical protein